MGKYGLAMNEGKLSGIKNVFIKAIFNGASESERECYRDRQTVAALVPVGNLSNIARDASYNSALPETIPKINFHQEEVLGCPFSYLL